jgi:hypothetical protein
VLHCRKRSGIIVAPDEGLTSEGVVIQKNFIAFNRQNGIRLRMNAREVKILNNTIFGNGVGPESEDDQSAISIRDATVRNVIIKNNIIEMPVRGAFHIQNREGASGIVVERNLYWNSGKPRLADVTDAKALYDDPLFKNPENNDFQLDSRSPAIDAGLNVGLPFKGVSPDLGAIEFGRL